MSTRSTTQAAPAAPSYIGPFIIVAALYFIFGFVTNLNMGLVPDLKLIFQIQKLANWQAMLANGAFFTAYFVFSAPSARLIEAIGYKKTMVVSLFIQVAGALLFLPASRMISFPLFLAAIFIVGAGVTALQVAANPYVAILGPERSAPIRLNLAQALNSLGGTIAPWVAGTFILTTTILTPAQIAAKSPAEQHDYQLFLANTVRMPYIIIAFGLLVLGIAVALLHLPSSPQRRSSAPARKAIPS
jgi:FHS family L-fucose permease-like MFS transporter